MKSPAISPSASASPSASPAPSPSPVSDTPADSINSPLPIDPAANAIEIQIQKWEERGREILKTLDKKNEDVKEKEKDKKDVWCVGEVAIAVAEELLDWAVKDVCVEEHWARWKEGGGDKLAVAIGVDGLLDEDDDEEEKDEKERDERKKATKNVNVVCSNCNGSIAAARYAQHLEKCLGRGGRSSSRAASARMKASAKRAEKEDMEQIQQQLSRPNGARKRRAGAMSVPPAGDAKDSGTKRTKSQSPPPPTRGRFGTHG